MNRLRNIVRAFLAVVIVAFALPVGAASDNTKYFWVEFPELVPAGNLTLQVKFNNATPPPGVSTINSIKIELVAPVPPGMQITAVRMVAPVVMIPSWTPSSGTAVVVTGFPGIKNNKFATFELTLSNPPTSCTSIHWKAYANTGQGYPGGDEFVQSLVNPSQLTTGMGCDGILYCENTTGNNYQFTDGTSGGKRLTSNKDGSPCIAVPYDFKNYTLAPSPKNIVSLVWDTVSQPNAAFTYTAIFNPEAVDPATGMPYASRRTRLAFEYDLSGNPVYYFGVACTSVNPPTVIGTLNSPLMASSGDNIVTINGTGLPTGTFDLVIGPPPVGSTTPERMTATWQSSNATSATYLVLRPRAGTPLAAHPAGAPVLTTPLPIDPNPTLADGTTPNLRQGKQVPMCIWDEGWVSSSPGMVRFSTSVFDIGGDGIINRDF